MTDYFPRLEPITTVLDMFRPSTLRELGIKTEAEVAADEAEERDRVLRHLAWLRKDYLAQIRTHLKRLDRPVTADDARAYFEQLPNVPGPDTISRNFLGATFKGPGWVATGDMVLSTTKGRHANRIFVWRWEGD